MNKSSTLSNILASRGLSEDVDIKTIFSEEELKKLSKIIKKKSREDEVDLNNSFDFENNGEKRKKNFNIHMTPETLVYQCRSLNPSKTTNKNSNTLSSSASSPLFSSSSLFTSNDLPDINSNDSSSPSNINSNNNNENNHHSKADKLAKKFNLTAASSNDLISQRKVADALIGMVSNPLMMNHFLYKGGYDALIKLMINKDPQVLRSCAKCLVKVSKVSDFHMFLITHNILSMISIFIELNDEELKYSSSYILSQISQSGGVEETLLMNGILGSIQNILHFSQKFETLSLLLILCNNISNCVLGNDAEILVRLIYQTTKKIDISKSKYYAYFIGSLYYNLTCLNHFSVLLVEEGVINFLLTLMDVYPEKKMMEIVSGSIANMSVNKKNRREIASSSILSRLTLLFQDGSPTTKANALFIMGNLLNSTSTSNNSGINTEKIVNFEIVHYILNNLMDIHHPKQFNSVSYCLAQLSYSESSCNLLIQCSVISIVLGFVRQAPDQSLGFLWMILVNISKYPKFFNDLIENINLLLNEIYFSVKFHTSTDQHQKSVAKICYNLTSNPNLKNFLNTFLLETLVKILKVLFSSPMSLSIVRYSSLISLINLSRYSVESRQIILSNDLIELFYDTGLNDDLRNVKYVALLNIISMEDSCSYKMLDLGVQKFLVNLQDSFQRLSDGNCIVEKDSSAQSNSSKSNNNSNSNNINGNNPQKYDENGFIMTSTSLQQQLQQQAQSKKEFNELQEVLNTLGEASLATKLRENMSNSNVNSSSIFNNTLNNSADQDVVFSNFNSSDYDNEGEFAKSLTASIIHNLALKRPVLAPGVLSMILNLVKNCRSIRVLHCIRALAHMSVHSKSKVVISKEAKKLVPLLTVIMRCGCDEAEKVQHYSSIILCNILALSLDKNLLLEFASNDVIGDLMVVTLLRINAVTTKETLAKAFFNLLCRSEIREILILKLDMLNTIFELIKLDYQELLELCIRVLYNITCELKPGGINEISYSNKLMSLNIPNLMISRIVYSPNLPGSVANRPIRMLVGMSIANMSYQKSHALEFISMDSKAVDAIARIIALSTEDSSYCAAIIMYNLSKYPECRSLAGDGKIIQSLVDLMTSFTDVAAINSTSPNPNHIPTNAIIVKLAVGTLCNLSMYPAFHDLITSKGALKMVVTLLSCPHVHISIKREGVQFFYNLLSANSHSRSIFVQVEGISSLWKLMKISANTSVKKSAGNDEVINNKSSSLTASTISAGTSSSIDDETFQNSDEAEDEEYIVLLTSYILKDVCYEVNDLLLYRKMLTDGLMNIILKLSKIELEICKINMSYCIYFITRHSSKKATLVGVPDANTDEIFVSEHAEEGESPTTSNKPKKNTASFINPIINNELIKILKRDAIDVFFWLSLHDTLGSFNLILKNISRAMRSFALSGEEESQLLIKNNRFFNILKVFIKSQNEDVLWQTIGIIYNVMTFGGSTAINKLLDNDLVPMIFDLANSGYQSVRHVCSACLHMIPEHLPNLDDPIALELILSLLEAKGDKFATVREKPVDILDTPLDPKYKYTSVVHTWTSLTASWTTYTCGIENVFTPALLYVPTSCGIQNNLVQEVDSSSFISNSKFQKLSESYFNEYMDNSSNNNEDDPTNGKSSIDEVIDLSISLPNLQAPDPFSDRISHSNNYNSSSSSVSLNNASKKSKNKQNSPLLDNSSEMTSEASSPTSTLPFLTPAPVSSIPTNTVELLKKHGVKKNSLLTSSSLSSFDSSLTYKPVGKKIV